MTKPKLFLFAVSLAVTVFLAEMLLRVFIPDGNIIYPRLFDKKPEGATLLVYDDKCGVRMRPGFSSKFMASDYLTEVKINSAGLRNPEIAQVKTKRRILTLGDSFTFGMGVNEDETFSRLIEKKFSGTSEVINSGVIGYDLYNEWLFYSHYGRGYKPDIVMLCLWLPDDAFHEFTKTFSKPADIDQVGTKISIQHFFRERSYLFNYVAENIIYNLDLRKSLYKLGFIGSSPEYMFEEPLRKTAEKNFIEMYNKNLNLIIELKKSCWENKSRLIVVGIPAREQVYDKFWKLIVQKYGLDENEFDRLRPQSIISSFCKANKIAFIDLTPGFMDRAQKGEMLYFTHYDPHLNRDGHLAAAEILYTYLQKKD